jgi:sugar/nucleoside kinase (ribokinase family)
VAGHICLDIIPDLSGISAESWAAHFRPGQLLMAGPVALSTGGPVSNTGLSLHRLGMATRLMGKVGDDLLSQVIRQFVAGRDPGLAAGMVIDPGSATSYTVIISPPGVDRIFLHHTGANDTFGADDIRYDVVRETRLFHFGYPPLMRRVYENDGAELVAIFRQVRDLGVTTSLDMAVPDPASPAGRADWRAILRAAMPYVDVFLPSVEEILYMLRRAVFDDLVARAGGGSFLPLIDADLLSSVSGELLDMGGRIVGLKVGDRGLYLRTAGAEKLAGLGAACPPDLAAWAGREYWAPCFRVNVVGTTGSGDATIAGFLSGLLRGLPAEETMTAAVAVGACNVEAADALSGVRPWEETLARIGTGWARRPLEVAAPGWRFDRERQLWVGPAA